MYLYGRMSYSNPAPDTLLRRAHLRVTPARLQVLRTFLAHPHALPHSELEHLVTDCDRVTLYRTLTTFTERGLLHKVPDDSGVTKYALCSEGCGESHHHDDHVHFKCSVCGQTLCLENTHLPRVTLPPGYEAQEVSLLVQGICQTCGRKT